MKISVILLFIAVNNLLFAQYTVTKKANLKFNPKSDKIILIDPRISDIILTDEVSQSYSNFEKNNQLLLKNLNKFSKKNEVTIEIFDNKTLKESDLIYYNFLVKLKSSISDVFWNQDHIINKESEYIEKNGYKKYIYIIPPKINPEFSKLADEYNTPYFAIFGCLNVDASDKKTESFINSASYYNVKNKKSFSYFIIVDVTTGELVFSVSRLNHYLFNSITLPPSMHDVFFIINETCTTPITN